MSLLLVLTGTVAGAFTLTCEGASLLLDGKNVNLKVDRSLTATAQSYTEDLKPANLYKSITAPTDIAQGIKGWFDASNSSSLTVSSANLTVWNDLSGQNDHLDTIQGNNPKSGLRTISGKNAIEFNNDGAIYDFDNTGGTAAPSATIAMVFVADAIDGTIVSSRTTLDTKIRLDSGSKLVMYGGSSNQAASTRNITTSQIYTAIGIFTGTTSKLWINGVSEDMSISSEDRLLIAMIGAGGAGDTDYFDGLVGEVAIYENALSDSEALSLHSYLYKKWVLDKTILSDSSSYALTSNNVNLTVNRSLTATAQSYALTGNDATLTKTASLTAESQSYALTSNNVTLTKTNSLTAESQSYAVTSNNINLTVNRSLTATAQSYAVTSNNVNLTVNRSLTATTQSYNISSSALILSRYIYIFCDSDNNGGTPNTVAPNTSTSKYQTSSVWPVASARWNTIGNAVNDATIIGLTDHVTIYIRGTVDFTGCNLTSLVNARSVTVEGDATGAVWDVSKATVLNASTLAPLTLALSVPMTVRNVQAWNTAASGTPRIAYCNGTGACTLENLKLRSTATSVTAGAGIVGAASIPVTVTARNCIVDVSGATTASSGLNLQTATVGNFYNCVFRGAATGATNGDNIVNCAFFGFATQGGTSAHYKYCATVNNTGSNPVAAISDWTTVFVDYANFDYRLKAASPLIGVGIGPASDANVPTTDIAGNARSGTTSDVGSANYISLGVTLAAVTSTFTLTPIVTGVIYGRRLTLDVAIFTLGSSANNLVKGKILVATVQTYVIASTEVTFFRGLRVGVTAQAFTLTGPPTNVLLSRKVTTDVRSYSFAPVPVTLLSSRLVPATKQTYTLSMTSANVLRSSSILATKQTYTISTSVTNFPRTFRLSTAQQTYTLVGVPVALFKLGAVIIIAASSATSLATSAVSLRVSRTVALSARSYSFVGNNVNTLKGFKLTGDVRSYAVATSLTNLNRGRILPLSAASFTLGTSSILNILRGRKLFGAQQTYTLTGNTTNLLTSRKLGLSVYATTLTRNPANLLAGRNLLAVKQTYTLSGVITGLKTGRKLTSTTQSYNFTFNQLLFARGGFIKVWTGSAWTPKPLKIWNGTAWVSKPLKVWTGSIWRTY